MIAALPTVISTGRIWRNVDRIRLLRFCHKDGDGVHRRRNNHGLHDKRCNAIEFWEPSAGAIFRNG
jgi:hypothetical protein